MLQSQQYFRGYRVYRAGGVIKVQANVVTSTPQLYRVPSTTSTKVITRPAAAVKGALIFLKRRHAIRGVVKLRVLSETRFAELIGTPTVIVAFTMFEEAVRLRLEVFATPQGTAEIAWVIQGALKNGIRFEMVVSASRKAPRVLFCTQTNACAAFQANWVRFPAEDPQSVPCPIRPIAPGGFGTASVWWKTGNPAEGPNASCHLASRSKAERLGPKEVDTPFVWCNLMRDFFHEFGFDGELYGFEGDDPIWTRRFTGALELGAECRLDSDGHGIYLDFYDSPSGGAHAATDPGIIVHEYTHAVTNRLLGGAAVSYPFQGTEGKGLDEGYSDYFSLTVPNFMRRQIGVAESRVMGGGFIPGSGIRDYTGFKRKWSQAVSDEYDIGMIWCGALLHARHSLAVPPDDADRFMWEAIILSLKSMAPLCASNCRLTLVHAKDALLTSAQTIGGGPLAGASAAIASALSQRNL